MKCLWKNFYHKYLRIETEKCYQKAVNQFVKRFPSKDIRELRFIDVIAWRKIALQTVKPVTWNNYVRHLKAIYAFGIAQDILPDPNPFAGSFIREDKAPKKTFTQEQINHINTILQQDFLPNCFSPTWFYQTIIKTLQYTAIRRGQLLKLNIENIDLYRGIIVIPAYINKNHRYHELPIGRQLRPLLENLINEHKLRGCSPKDQLFNVNKFTSTTYRIGKDMTGDQLSYFFRRLSSLAGFMVSPHRFRHTIATNLMKDPRNVYIVQQLLGHTSLTVTLGYIQNDPENLREIMDSI